MTMFEQLVATAFGVVRDLIVPAKPPEKWLSRYVYEAQQLRLRLGNARRDLRAIVEAPKATKVQIVDRVHAVLNQLDQLETELRDRDAVQNVPQH